MTHNQTTGSQDATVDTVRIGLREAMAVTLWRSRYGTACSWLSAKESGGFAMINPLAGQVAAIYADVDALLSGPLAKLLAASDTGDGKA